MAQWEDRGDFPLFLFSFDRLRALGKIDYLDTLLSDSSGGILDRVVIFFWLNVIGILFWSAVG